jgi:hypothetical protein
MAATPNSIGQGSSASAFAITPSDTVDLTYPTRAIYVGVGGNLEVILTDDTIAVILLGVVTGGFYPLSIKRVKAGSTTATNLIGLR